MFFIAFRYVGVEIEWLYFIYILSDSCSGGRNIVITMQCISRNVTCEIKFYFSPYFIDIEKTPKMCSLRPG